MFNPCIFDHRIKVRTKYGADETYRLHGAPDRDMAAMFVLNKYSGCKVKSVDAIYEDAPFIHSEYDIGEYEVIK